MEELLKGLLIGCSLNNFAGFCSLLSDSLKPKIVVEPKVSSFTQRRFTCKTVLSLQYSSGFDEQSKSIWDLGLSRDVNHSRQVF